MNRWTGTTRAHPVDGLTVEEIRTNHALVDGNKRLAWAAAQVFCLLNGRDLTSTVDDAERLMLAAASGGLDVPELAQWISEPP